MSEKKPAYNDSADDADVDEGDADADVDDPELNCDDDAGADEHGSEADGCCLFGMSTICSGQRAVGRAASAIPDTRSPIDTRCLQVCLLPSGEVLWFRSQSGGVVWFLCF